MARLQAASAGISLLAWLSLLSANPVGASAQTSSGTAASWTQWGFNAQHTGYNPKEVTLSRSAVGSLHPVFHTGLVTGPDPIVVNGTVYLAGPGTSSIQAVDATTGAKLWTRYNCFGEAATDPAFADGAVWVGLGDPGMESVSSSGTKVRCFQGVGYDFTPLSTARGVVYAGDEYGDVGAVDASTGATLWFTTLSNCCVNVESPAVSPDGSAVYAATDDGHVYKLDAKTGKLIWKRFVDTCAGSAVSVSVMVFVGGCNLYALSPSTGATVWHSTHFGPYVMTPAIIGGTIIAGARGSGYYTGVAAFNATTGERLWLNFEENPTSPPTVADGVVYVNQGGDLQMLNSATGNGLGDVFAPDTGNFSGSVVPVDGRVYVCTVSDSGAAWLWAYAP